MHFTIQNFLLGEIERRNTIDELEQDAEERRDFQHIC
jgi:hypothetical protein